MLASLYSAWGLWLTLDEATKMDVARLIAAGCFGLVSIALLGSVLVLAVSARIEERRRAGAMPKWPDSGDRPM